MRASSRRLLPSLGSVSKLFRVISERGAYVIGNFMKMHTVFSRKLMSHGLCVAVLLATVGYSGAQSSFNDKAPGKVIPDVVFDSLPVSEVVTFLRDKFPDVNFVTVGPVERVHVSLELRNVRLGDILLAMQLATDHALEIDDAGERIVAIRASADNGRSRKVVRAFDISGYLERAMESSGGSISGSIEEIVKERNRWKAEAVAKLEELLQSTWHNLYRADHGRYPTREDRQTWPHLSFHSEAGILVAIGEGRQLEVIEEIVGALEKQ